jgi:TRAP transporter TAXI family solute receptor
LTASAPVPTVFGRPLLADDMASQDHPPASGHGPGARLPHHHRFDPAPLTVTLRNRLRRLLRNKTLLIFAFLVLVVGVVGPGIHFFKNPPVMTLAAGPDGSDEARLAELITKIVARETWSSRIRPVTTSGPLDSGDAMKKGQVDLAIVRSDLGMPPNGQVVAVLRQSVMVLIVPASGAKTNKSKKKGAKIEGAKIEKVMDLAGRRLGVVSGGDKTEEAVGMLLKQYGIPPDKIDIVPIAPDQVRATVENKAVDAILLIGPLSGRFIGDAMAASGDAKNELTVIDLQGPAIEKRYPGYKSIDIDAGTYGGNPPQPSEDAKAPGFQSLLVARKDVSDTKIFDFSKILYAARAELADAFPDSIKIEAPSTDKDAALPVHSGTAGFLADSYKTFFDRYGDLIFYGLLIAPVFGSVFAGVAGFVRADVRTQRLRLINQLLAIITRAREADAPAALDHLQIETDKILRVMLHKIGTNEFDDDDVESFTLVLDEVRLAIADRRAALAVSRGKPAPVLAS